MTRLPSNQCCRRRGGPETGKTSTTAAEGRNPTHKNRSGQQGASFRDFLPVPGLETEVSPRIGMSGIKKGQKATRGGEHGVPFFLGH
jgi:hypothetical protein